MLKLRYSLFALFLLILTPQLVSAELPEDYSNLTLWLDAADSATVIQTNDNISEWKDKSGGSNHVMPIGTLPTVSTSAQNGLATITFSSSGLVTSDDDQITANGSYTKFVVYKVNQAEISGSNNLVSSSVTALYVHQSKLKAFGGGTNFLEDTNNLGTGFHVSSMRYGKPSNLANVLRLDASQVATNGDTKTHTSAVTTIGSFGSVNNNNSLNGEIAEVLIYNGALTDIEITAIENGLTNKWITAPVDPTLTITASTPSTVGDSITVTPTTNSTGAVTYTATALPIGMCTVDLNTGEVTATEAGVCSVTASLAASTGYTTRYNSKTAGPFEITFDAAPIVPVDPNLTVTAPATATVGTTFTVGSNSDSDAATTYSSTTTGICTVSGTTVTPVTLGTCTLKAEQVANTNYLANSATKNVTVSAAPIVPVDPNLTVTAPATATVGTTFTVGSDSDSDAATTYSSTTTGICTVSGTTVTPVTVGTCTLKAEQVANTNYLADSATKNVTVNAAPIVQVDPNLTVTVQATATIGTSFTVGSSSDSSAAISYSSTTTNICTVSGITVIPVSAGTCTLKAEQVANTNYLADSATKNVTVSTAPIAPIDPQLTLSGAPATANVGESFSIGHSTNSAGAITFTSSNSAICSVNETTGKVTALATGSCVISASQAATTGYLADSATATATTISAAAITPENTTLSISSPVDTAVEGNKITLIKETNSNGTITFNTKTAAVCLVEASSGEVTPLKAGTCTVEAQQVATTNYKSTTATVSIPVNSKAFEAILGVINGSNTTPLTKAQLEKIGLHNVKSNVSYNKVLKDYDYVDREDPTFAELQNAVNKANSDANSSGGSPSTLWLMMLGLAGLVRRKMFS